MLATTWQPFIVGVDASPAAVRAARFAVALADRADVPCQLVHAVPEVWTLPPPMFAQAPEEMNLASAAASAAVVRAALEGEVPTDVLDAIETRIGRPALALADAAEEHGAGLVIVGGKHHSALGRWVAGSTAHAVVRTAPVPVLVTAGEQLPHRRVLCAVDISEAARPTIHAATRWATMLGAELTVLHAIEPMPLFLEAPFAMTAEDHEAHVEEALGRTVWPVVPADAERLVRHGDAVRVITEEVARRGADLVVVGSHGRGWFDRILIGSVTERLLGALPTGLLVVPVAGPASQRRRTQFRSHVLGVVGR